MNKASSRLSWKDYPQPRMVLLRGVYNVEVSIPRAIRHLFGSGSGATNNRRKSTSTSDLALASKRLLELTHVIYQEFDQAQIDDETKWLKAIDDFSIKTITELPAAFKYGKGSVPMLSTKTDVKELIKLKSALDGYGVMIRDESPTFEEMMAGLDAKEAAVTDEERNAIDIWPSQFTDKQISLSSHYKTAPVQNFLNDLIIQTAAEQGVEQPIVDGRKYSELVLIRSGLGVKLMDPGSPRTLGVPKEHIKPLARPRFILSPAPLTVMAVQKEYLAMLDRDFDKAKTKGKLTRGVATFVDLMGDLPLAQITSKTAYDYADSLLAKNPTYANQTITDYVWYSQTFIKFCVRKGYMDSNPFRDIDVRKYGVPTKNYH